MGCMVSGELCVEGAAEGDVKGVKELGRRVEASGMLWGA